MQVEITLTDLTDPTKKLVVRGIQDQPGVVLELAGSSRTLDHNLLERGIGNAVNVGVSSNPKFIVRVDIIETNSPHAISITSHPTDRHLVILQIDEHTINVSALEFRKSVRSAAL